MKENTQQKIKTLPLAEQVAAYFSDSSNQGNSGYRSVSVFGPRYSAQCKFWNDWQCALSEWINTLPQK